MDVGTSIENLGSEHNTYTILSTGKSIKIIIKSPCIKEAHVN